MNDSLPDILLARPHMKSKNEDPLQTVYDVVIHLMWIPLLYSAFDLYDRHQLFSGSLLWSIAIYFSVRYLVLSQGVALLGWLERSYNVDVSRHINRSIVFFLALGATGYVITRILIAREAFYSSSAAFLFEVWFFCLFLGFVSTWAILMGQFSRRRTLNRRQH